MRIKAQSLDLMFVAASLRLPQAANRQFEDSPNAFTCSAGHTLLRDDLAGEAAIPVRRLIRSQRVLALQIILTQQDFFDLTLTPQDDIFVAARDLLSEEAVRCAVKILQVSPFRYRHPCISMPLPSDTHGYR